MQLKITFVGYPPFAELAKKVCESFNLPSWVKYEVTEVPLQLLISPDSVRQLKDQFEPSTVVISGDRSALLLKRVIPNLIIPVSVRGFDLLETIQTLDITDEVVVVNYRKNIDEINNISSLLKVKIKQLTFHNIEEAHQILKQLQKEKRKFVIGGSWVCANAPKYGMEGIFYYSQGSMTHALNFALKFLEAYRERLEQFALFKTIVDMNQSGIIYTDRYLRIKVMSEVTESLLGMKRNQAIEKPLYEVIPHFPLKLQTKLNETEPEYNIMFEHQHKKFIADVVPIILQGENMGHIIMFDDIMNVQAKETNIRQKITQKPMIAQYRFEHIVGSSRPIQEAVEQAKKYSQVDSSILIHGESGTGKELFAQSIHNASKRSKHPFVAVNCAAIPENLIDSELFGYEEGAFTGAKKGGKAGLFELAHRGTIFLDEISELPLHLQGKLLRVLQEKEVVRIGGDRVIPINVRIIVASNKDLVECIRNHTFREDLYYRISVLHLNIPPLRERKEDIPLLFKHFLKGYEPLASLVDESLLESIKSYHWPGNIRELKNVVERFRVLLSNEKITPSAVREALHQALSPALDGRSKLDIDPLVEKEKELILQALIQANGNRDKAAKQLGISRTTLWRKLKKYNLNQP